MSVHFLNGSTDVSVNAMSCNLVAFHFPCAPCGRVYAPFNFFLRRPFCRSMIKSRIRGSERCKSALRTRRTSFKVETRASDGGGKEAQRQSSFMSINAMSSNG